MKLLVAPSPRFRRIDRGEGEWLTPGAPRSYTGRVFHRVAARFAECRAGKSDSMQQWVITTCAWFVLLGSTPLPGGQPARAPAAAAQRPAAPGGSGSAGDSSASKDAIPLGPSADAMHAAWRRLYDDLPTVADLPETRDLLEQFRMANWGAANSGDPRRSRIIA